MFVRLVDGAYAAQLRTDPAELLRLARAGPRAAVAHAVDLARVATGSGA
mgnify:CR=1 FL=1